MTAPTIVNTRGAQRLSVLEAVRAEADSLFASIASTDGLDECDLPTRILVQLSAVLETTREAGSTIKLKAKAKGRGHVHHQLALEVDDGQAELGLEEDEDLDPDDDEDLRPVGEVNADELKGAASRDVQAAERADGADDDALLPA